jgi:hypothetical protein
MFALPAPTALTTPELFTVATAAFELVQASVRPVSTLPLASLSTAVACVVRPVATLLDPSETLTDATGTTVTVTLACPVTPSLVATMFAVPAPAADTAPVPLTVATAVLELVHAIVRPVRTLPPASFSTAVACVVCPTVRLPEPRDTVTEATGTVTVRLACPLMLSLVALMFALPAPTAVTSPELETVATAVFELAHVTVRPVNTFPLASLSTTLPCTVCPATRLPEPNDTLTEATGGTVTVTPACPVTPSLVATIFALPAPIAVTTPEPLTLATPVLELAHVTVRPVRTLPLASFSTGVASVVCPTRILAAPNDTLTEVTGASVTVTLDCPVTPSLVATILALPGAVAVANPVVDTVATPVFELVHVTDRPLNTFPLASFRTTVAWVVCPTCTLEAPSDTVTDATGAGGAATTATVPCPVTPSLVATTLALPNPTAVTRPLPFTVATPVFELVQLIARPVSTLLLASLSTAVA